MKVFGKVGAVIKVGLALSVCFTMMHCGSAAEKAELKGESSDRSKDPAASEKPDLSLAKSGKFASSLRASANSSGDGCIDWGVIRPNYSPVFIFKDGQLFDVANGVSSYCVPGGSTSVLGAVVIGEGGQDGMTFLPLKSPTKPSTPVTPKYPGIDANSQKWFDTLKVVFDKGQPCLKWNAYMATGKVQIYLDGQEFAKAGGQSFYCFTKELVKNGQKIGASIQAKNGTKVENYFDVKYP